MDRTGCNPTLSVESLKDWQTINADSNEDAIVEAAMANIDAEYEALCAEYALAPVTV